ncbi:MAG: SAM-dependent methyltransferase [Friedmanniella sp.]
MTSPAAAEPDHQHQHHLDPEDLARMFSQEFWDERYASASALWSGKPNQRLVEQVADLAPGTALDVGCGEGADALWLASRGWQVTGLDISPVALGRAAARAAEAGPEIEARVRWEQVDLLSWSPRSQVDLVSAQFIHLPPEESQRVQRQLEAAVRPGGTLLVVGHDKSDLETTVGRPPVPALFASAAETAARLDPDVWDVVVADALERTALDPDGRTVTIRDAVMKAVRRS